MSWEIVNAAIDFWDESDDWGILDDDSGTEFTETQQNMIRSYLQQLYQSSPEAAALLERGAALSTGIRLYQTATEAGLAYPGTGLAGFNLSAINTFYYFESGGKFVQERPEITIIHELFHAIDSLTDPSGAATEAEQNSTSFDFDGDTVREQNIVATQMGWLDHLQVTYYSGIYTNNSRYSKLRQDISYSEGNEINIARFGSDDNGTEDTLDLSMRPEGSQDLVFGFDGIDNIFTGRGRDYLYGGTGNDILSGGSHDDLLHGGDRLTAINQDGFDTADFSIGDLGEAPPNGISVEINASAVNETIDDIKPIIVIDGYGGRDRLVSIENIKLTEHSDRVSGDWTLEGYGLTDSLLQIDGLGSDDDIGDVIDFSGRSSGVNVTPDPTSGVPTIVIDNITIKLNNFVSFVGTGESDGIALGAGGQWLYGASGDDELDGGDDDDVLEGGADFNGLTGGDGADWFIVGMGDDLIVDANAGDSLFIRLSTINPFAEDLTEDIDFLIPISGGFFLHPAWDESQGNSFENYNQALFWPVTSETFPTGDDDVQPIYEDLTTDYAITFMMEESDLLISIYAWDDFVPFWSEPPFVVGIQIDPLAMVLVADYETGDLGLTFEEIINPFYTDGVEEFFFDNIPTYTAKHEALLDNGVFEEFPTIEALVDPEHTEDGDDLITGTGGSDQIAGGFGNDIVLGRGGADTLSGEAGNDRIDGGADNDTITGGVGDDVLQGGSGDDTFVYSSGDGNDVIRETQPIADIDTLDFADLAVADVRFGRRTDGDAVDDDLIIQIAPTGETITIQHQFGPNGSVVEQFHFDGEVSLNLEDIQSLTWLLGTEEDNEIFLSEDAFTNFNGIDGLGGFDVLGYQDFYSKAYDVDLDAGSFDIENVGSIAIENFEGVFGSLVDDIIRGNDQANYLDGFFGNDTLIGRGGNDTLARGGVGSSILDGGSGIDAAVGYSGEWSIVLEGGIWKVTDGTYADELYGVEKVVIDGITHLLVDQLGENGGFQSIQAAVTAAVGGDVILIGPGTYDEDITITGKNLIIKGSGDTGPSATALAGQITVDGTLNGALTIRDLAVDAAGHQYGIFVSANSDDFAGSVTLDNVTISNAQRDGFAYIREGNGSTPTLADTIGVVSILHSEFFGNATLTSGSNGRGDILLFGFNGNLTIDDVSIHNPGAGAQKALQVRGIQDGSDVIGAGPYDAAGTVSLTDLTVTGSYSQDLLAFYRIASFSSFTTDNVELNASAPWGLFNFDEVGGTIDLLTGITATNQSGSVMSALQGLASADNLIGTEGRDYIDGRDGADSLNGGNGDDIFLFSNAAHHDVGETIDGGLGADVIRFTSTSSGQILALTSGVTNIEEIEISNASGANTGTAAVNLDASAVTGSYSLTGNNGANTLTAGVGANVIEGGGGNDMLTGGLGDDTFIFRSGFGQDAITDFTAGESSEDVIEFHDGLFADVAAILAAASESGNDTIITVNAATKITLQNVALANLHQDDFLIA